MDPAVSQRALPPAPLPPQLPNRRSRAIARALIERAAGWSVRASRCVPATARSSAPGSRSCTSRSRTPSRPRSPASTSPTTSSTSTCPSCSAAGSASAARGSTAPIASGRELVVAMTSWGRRDFIESYGLPDGEGPGGAGGIRPPRVPGSRPPRTSTGCARRLSLPESFLLYPAQTWPHKNHERPARGARADQGRERAGDPAGLPRQADPLLPPHPRRGCRARPARTTSFPGFVSSLELRGLYELGDRAGLPEPVRGLGAAGLRGLLRGSAGCLLHGDGPPRPRRRRGAALRPR